MKTIKTALIIAIVALATVGCNKSALNSDDINIADIELGYDAAHPRFSYLLCVGFLDSKGNDLTAPLAVEQSKEEGKDWNGPADPARYNLNIILSNGVQSDSENLDSFTMYNFFARVPEFEKQYGRYDGHYFLFNHYFDYFEPESCLTYQITCPTVFGDNSVHELVTWWGDDPEVAYRGEEYAQAYDSDGNRIMDQYLQCTKALFDGREVSIKRAVFYVGPNNRAYYSHFIDIVLDE